jgi:putative hydroxymethylpyrimidine transporter CytX
MPLSWLPLIADYTRNAEAPKKISGISAVVYFFTSCWMHGIGMGAALFTGETDIASIMIRAGQRYTALVIIIFSTVTTIFLDVYSAGVSSESICKKWRGKSVSIVVCVIGVLLAVFTPITRLENFLYLIGSVFAPMITILIVDYFVFGNDFSRQDIPWHNFFLWMTGFIAYRIFLRFDTPLGNTVPVMILTAVLCVIVHKIKKTH